MLALDSSNYSEVDNSLRIVQLLIDHKTDVNAMDKVYSSIM
jgi:hypothetical protein